MLLLHCDGSDASTTFTDSSTGGVNSPHTITANNQAQIDTAQSKFGGASGLFDGTGDYLSSADSADWDFGTADFTIDFWVRFNADEDMAIDLGNGNTNNGILLRYGSVNHRWEVYINGTEITDTGHSFTPTLATWYHIAVTRSGTSLKIFVAGSQVGNTETNSSDIQCTQAISIGRNAGGSFDLNGWLDEVRISKGIARWTSNFTPPTAAYS